jgi:hypothetical protein
MASPHSVLRPSDTGMPDPFLNCLMQGKRHIYYGTPDGVYLFPKEQLECAGDNLRGLKTHGAVVNPLTSDSGPSVVKQIN